MSHRLDQRTFADPPGTFRPIPFWFWNGELDERELDRQLREMKDKGVLEAFIHARRGLLVPYLSEAWFRRVAFTIQKAAEYGMRMWLYDEDNWPSGYAGGRVLKADPDCRTKNLARVVVPIDGNLTIPEGKLVAATAVMADGSNVDVTQDFSNPGSYPSKQSYSSYASIHFFMERYGHWQPAYTEDYYVDLINPKCTSEFIRSTHEEYYRRFGPYFGNTVAGIFTDEPGFYNNFWERDPDTNVWTGDFLAQFKRIKGYDLKPHLVSLWDDIGDFRRIRADYYDVLSILFRDVYFKPIYDWCAAHKVQSIGHVTIEEKLKYHARMFGGFFRSMEYLHVPGVDEIGQLRANPNEITPKLGSSAAHVFGRERCMSETFGVYGWKLTLEEMKATTDLQYARGVNFFVPHAFYYSIEGDRKEECPPSEFWQNVWWKYFKHYADYVGRLSYMNTLGHHVADIAVYYPLPSVWAEIKPSDTSKPDEIDARLKEISTLLLENQRDFDYLNDDAIRTAVYGADGQLHIREEGYSVLIIPSATVMAVDTAERLAEFVRLGGTVIILGAVPRHAVINGTDQELNDIFFNLAKNQGKGKLFQVMKAEDALTILNQVVKPDLALDHHEPTINYLHRRNGTADVYFIADRSPENEIFTAGFRCTNIPRRWDPETGEVTDVPEYTQSDGYTHVPIDLNGYGSTYIVFTPDEDRPHVVDTNIPDITGCTAEQVAGTCRHPGMFYADVAMGDEVIRRTGSVTSVPEPIELKTGWTFRLEGESEAKPIELGSWTEQGHEDYSGSAVYEITVDLPDDYTGRPLILDLGKVRETAEVLVNGKPAGHRLWRPYSLDIRQFVVPGTNKLEIIVTNTLANRFTADKLPSGLLGPVKLIPLAEVVLE